MDQSDVLKYLEEQFTIGLLPDWCEIEGDFILEKDAAFFEFDHLDIFENRILMTFEDQDVKSAIIIWLGLKGFQVTTDSFQPALVISEDYYNSGAPLPSKFLVQLTTETIEGWKDSLNRNCNEDGV